VDFYCHARRLVIEIDGDSHTTAEDVARDQRRTREIERLGYRVRRFTNVDVHENIDGVLTALYEACFPEQ
jgi:very-short-patch-repair endonuclease